MSTEEYQERERFYERMKKNVSLFSELDLEVDGQSELQKVYSIRQELERIGERYTDLGEIARGGMKVISKVHDRKLDKVLALAKPLKPESPEFLEAFLREARLSSQLKHPHIISVYDIGLDEEDIPYFTMDHLEGKSLQDVIEEKKMPREKRIAIFLKVCEAVAYSHSNNILHLDLKPENIKLGEDGEVYLHDWGLARILTKQRHTTQTIDLDVNVLNHATSYGRIKGSLGYMAPEQASKGGEKNFQTDIYGLGSLLYALLIGKPPIKSASSSQMIEDTIEGKLHPIPAELKLSERLKKIILKCLETEPAERYQSVQLLKTDFENYLTGYATLAEDAGVWTHFHLLFRRHRGKVLVSAFALLAATVCSLEGVRRIDEARRAALVAEGEAMSERSRAEQNFHRAEENFQQLKTEQQLTVELTQEAKDLVVQIAGDSSFKNPAEKIALLEKGLSLEESPAQKKMIQEALVELYFVNHRFRDVIQLEETVGKVERLAPLYVASRMASRYVKKGRVMTHQEAARVIENFYFKIDVEITKAFYLRHLERRGTESKEGDDPIKLVSVMLGAINNDLRKFKKRNLLSFDGSTLKIEKPGYAHLSFDDENILSLLKFENLDLSQNSSFYDYNQLIGLKIRKLDLSGCPMNVLNRLRLNTLKSLGISELSCDEVSFNRKSLDLLKNHFRVSVTPVN